MITICQFKTYQKKVFNKFSRFALIGNIIDGFVNVNIIEFENYDAVKSLLPNIIKNLIFEGEWKLILYQISGPLRIRHLYGYYKVPFRGKKILHLSYMNVAKHREATLNDALIHVYSYNDLDFYEYDKSGEPKHGTIYEIYVTVLLFNEKIKKSDVMEEFIGS